MCDTSNTETIRDISIRLVSPNSLPDKLKDLARIEGAVPVCFFVRGCSASAAYELGNLMKENLLSDEAEEKSDTQVDEPQQVDTPLIVPGVLAAAVNILEQIDLNIQVAYTQNGIGYARIIPGDCPDMAILMMPVVGTKSINLYASCGVQEFVPACAAMEETNAHNERLQALCSQVLGDHENYLYEVDGTFRCSVRTRRSFSLDELPAEYKKLKATMRKFRKLIASVFTL